MPGRMDGQTEGLVGEEREGKMSPGASPLPPPPLNTIQSEQSSVALSTFSSASKCQAMFGGGNTVTLGGGKGGE